MAEREGSGVARSAQHTVHVLPHAPHVIARFLGPALERVAEDAEGTQLLVITADGDTALAIAEVARTISDRSAAPIVPLTAAGRGARLASSRVIPAIAAAPSTLASLLRSSAVKLAGVRTVVIAWADELFPAREDEALEIVLAEIPKDASRIVVTDRMTPEVEALVERHLRRASRVAPGAPEESVASVAVRYVSTASAGRRSALRRLLDDLDPPSAIVVANDAGGADEARGAVAALGYESEAAVRVMTGPPEEQTSLVVLYDLPASAAELAQIAASEPAQVVALVTPRQVPALRRLTTGAVEPLDVSQSPAKARARDERLRATLRAELQSGFPAREVMALEPLLAEFDGLEIAAAALRFFERERAEARARRTEAERPAERPAERVVERAPERTVDRADRPVERAPRSSRGDGDFARVFVSIGERDGVRPGDLVGAITGETGISSDRIGKLDIRESHTVAEIAAADAPMVIEKMNGVSLKGRRLTLRVDDRPAPRARDGGREFGREGARGGREGGRPAGRSGPREGGRGGFGSPRSGPPREGGRPSFGGRGRPERDSGGGRGFSRPGRDSGGGGGFSRPGRPPRAGGPPGRERDAGGERRPRRDDGPPRERGGFGAPPDDGRIPRATREREEWSDRADRVRNARRPRRDEA